MDEALKALRERIDSIDDSILQLVSERAGIAQQVGHTKKGEKIYRPEREAQIVRRLREANPGPLSGDVIERLIREVISACRALEQTLRIAYLGPAGTFSQQAVHKHFGHEADAMAEADIDACFHAVETGRADFAVVPVENSTEGAIARTRALPEPSASRRCTSISAMRPMQWPRPISTPAFMRSKPAAQISPWCRWRTRPKAPLHARSTSSFPAR